MPVDGYALTIGLKWPLVLLGQGGHFAYVINTHTNNATRSIMRRIFAYTACTPFHIGQGELPHPSIKWNEGNNRLPLSSATRWKIFFPICQHIISFSGFQQKLSCFLTRYVFCLLQVLYISGWQNSKNWLYWKYKKGAPPVDGYALTIRSKWLLVLRGLAVIFCILWEFIEGGVIPLAFAMGI